LKQGQEAKERVLSGMYNRPQATETTSKSSRRDRLKPKDEVYPKRQEQAPADMRYVQKTGTLLDKIGTGATPTFNAPNQQGALPTFSGQPTTIFDQPTPPTGYLMNNIQTAKPSPTPEQKEVQDRQKAAESSRFSRFNRAVTNTLSSGIDKFLPGTKSNVPQTGLTPLRRAYDVVANTPINIPGTRADDAVANFLRGVGNTATFGLSSYLDRMTGAPERAEGATHTTAGKVGEIAGYMMPGGAAEGAFRVASKVAAPIANRGLRWLMRGTTAGELYGAGREAGEYGFGVNDQSLSERLKDIAVDAALGGAGDLALSGAGTLAKGLVSRLRRSGVPEEQVQEILALPMGREGLPEGQMGIPEPPVTVPSRPAPEPAEAMKGNWFTNLFGHQGLGIRAGGATRSRNTATTEGQIVNNPLKRDVQGLKGEVQARTRAAYQNHMDELSALDNLGRDVYDTAMDTRRANNIANTITQDKFVDLEGNVIGEGLRNIIRKVARGEGNAFDDYLILRHAKTRMERGENVYDPKLQMTPEKVQQRIDMYNERYPGFNAIAQEWDGFNENLLRTFGEKEGLLSKAQVDAMREANPNYASMRRQFSTSEKYAQPFTAQTRGFSGQKAPIKEVSPTGSVRKIVSPIRTAIEATGAWTNAAMRNRVMQSLVERIHADPDAFKGIAEIVGESADASKKSLDDINKILNDDGMEGLLDALNSDFSLLFKKGIQQAGKNDNVVRAMIDGKPVKVKIENPEVLKALVGLGPEQASLVMDMFGGLSNLTKRGATGALAPLFAVKSLSADTLQALIQSPQPVRHVADLGYALISSIANKLPRNTPGFNAMRSLAQDFERTGGEYSAALMSDKALNKSVRGMRKEPFLSPRFVRDAVINTAASPFKVLHGIGDISENVNRMAAYKGALRRGGNARTPENIRQAMRESQEITTNFSRKGAQGKQLEKFIPYHNAAMQGMRRFFVQWKKNPVKTLAMVTLGVLAPKLYEYSQFADDPDYQRLPARDKYRNLFINKNEDGTFTKVPMPMEYAGLGALMVDLLREYKDNDPVNWRMASDALVNAYTPPFVSGALQGVTQGGGLGKSIFGALNSTSIAAPIAVASNQSFTGAPIVPRELQSNSEANQYDERTSGVAKMIGDKVGLSPIKVDYLIRAYGGDPARLLLPLNSAVGAGTPRNTLLKSFITDPVFTNTLTTDFYNMKNRITQAESDFGNTDVALPAWYNEGVADSMTSRKAGSITKRLSELKSEKQSIQVDRSLSAEAKAQKLRDVQARMNLVYLEGIEAMQRGGVPSGR
jgi:hypothetical protein